MFISEFTKEEVVSAMAMHDFHVSREELLGNQLVVYFNNPHVNTVCVFVGKTQRLLGVILGQEFETSDQYISQAINDLKSGFNPDEIILTLDS